MTSTGGRSNLPAETTSLVGRRRDLTEVRRRLAQARLVTVVGVGGVGKTRLALRAARAEARSYPDGTWLLCLSEWDGATPVAEFLGRAGLLGDRRALLVIDSGDRPAAASGELCGRLLRAAPGLRILATGRVPLRVAGEHAHALAPGTPRTSGWAGRSAWTAWSPTPSAGSRPRPRRRRPVRPRG